MRRLTNWSRNQHALSPIFATVLLATFIIVFGSVTFYYSTNLTSTATNNYVSYVANSQQSISERIAFENVFYNVSSRNLTVYIINCGNANNLKINSLIVNNATSTITHTISNTDLKKLDTGATISSFNSGQEGYFIAQLGTSLTSGAREMYTIHLISQSGSTFVYEFAP